MEKLLNDVRGLNEYPTFTELRGVRFDADANNLIFTLQHPPPCDEVTVRATAQYIENYPVGPLSLMIGDQFHVLPTAEHPVSNLSRHVHELCQMYLRTTPSTFGRGFDDEGMGTPSTSWLREGTIELAPGSEEPAAGLNPQIVSDATRISGGHGVSFNDMPAIGKCTVHLTMALNKLMSKQTALAWGLTLGSPLEIRLVMDRAEYLKAPMTVEVGQPAHFASGVFRGMVGQVQRILQKMVDSLSVVEQEPETPLAELLAAGFDEALAIQALNHCKNNASRAAALLMTADREGFADGSAGKNFTGESTTLKAKKYPKPTQGFFQQLVDYFIQRIPSLPDFCVLCDRPHVFGATGSMVQAAVCSRELCLFRFQELAVGANIADSVAVQTAVIDLLLTVAVAAANSSRWELIFNPFPAVFDDDTLIGKAAGGSRAVLSQDKKDINLAKKILNSMPNMKKLSQVDSAGDLRDKLKTAHPLAGAMFNWVISSNRSHLIQIPEQDRLSCMGTPLQFVMCTASPELQERFNKRKQAHGGKTTWVFHGSRAENWHSIMRNGLKNASGTKFQVNGAAHGSGIYLSPSAGVSFGYSGISTGSNPGTATTDQDKNFIDQKSFLCIAVMELVDVDTRKSGNIWVQPHEDCVQTRFFFVYHSQMSYGGRTELVSDPATTKQFDEAAKKFCT